MRKRLASLAALAAVAVLVPAVAADAAKNDGSPNDPRAKAFVKEVSVDRVERHQERLQQIATANGGTRDVFGTGYTASVDYVVHVLENAGYNPEVTPFNFPFSEESRLPVLDQVTPTPVTYRPGTATRAIRRTSTSSPSAARRRRRSTTHRSSRSAGSRSRPAVRRPTRRRAAATRPTIPPRWRARSR